MLFLLVIMWTTFSTTFAEFERLREFRVYQSCGDKNVLITCPKDTEIFLLGFRSGGHHKKCTETGTSYCSYTQKRLNSSEKTWRERMKGLSDFTIPVKKAMGRKCNLLAKYHCLTTGNHNQYSKCSTEPVRLSCKDPKEVKQSRRRKILIRTAQLEYHPNDTVTCGIAASSQHKSTCTSQAAVDTIRDLCQFKEVCEFLVSPSSFSDLIPADRSSTCPPVSAVQLQIVYRCPVRAVLARGDGSQLDLPDQTISPTYFQTTTISTSSTAPTQDTSLQIVKLLHYNDSVIKTYPPTDTMKPALELPGDGVTPIPSSNRREGPAGDLAETLSIIRDDPEKFLLYALISFLTGFAAILILLLVRAQCKYRRAVKDHAPIVVSATLPRPERRRQEEQHFYESETTIERDPLWQVRPTHTHKVRYQVV